MMPDKTENSICIEDIMNEIRAEIKEKGYDSSMLSFEDITCDTSLNDRESVNTEDFSKNLQYVNLNGSVQPYKELSGGKLVVLFRKVLRKLIKFYIEPVVDDQNQLNIRFVRMFNFIENRIKAEPAGSDINELSKQISDLELRIKTVSACAEKLEKENEELKKRLAKLEES